LPQSLLQIGNDEERFLYCVENALSVWRFFLADKLAENNNWKKDFMANADSFLLKRTGERFVFSAGREARIARKQTQILENALRSFGGFISTNSPIMSVVIHVLRSRYASEPLLLQATNTMKPEDSKEVSRLSRKPTSSQGTDAFNYPS
jgi:hypothetical protein